MNTIKVRDLMTEKVVTVREDASFKEVVEKLMIYDVSSVPVVDDEGRLLGIVTEADVLSKEAHGPGVRPDALLFGPTGRWLRKAQATEARELMTRDPVTTAPDEDVRVAARRMIRKGVKRLPVVEGGFLVGILSRHDVLDVFDRPDDEVRDAVEARLADLAFFLRPHAFISVRVADGVVTLAGEVRFTGDAAVAENVTAAVEGVVGVENRLRARHVEPQTLPL